MIFLEKQRKDISKVVSQINAKDEDTIRVMNKMNIHMHGIVKDLTEVDSLVNQYRTKQKQKK